MFSDSLQKNIKIILWIIAVIVFQTVICGYIAVDGIIPDIVFVFTIAFVVLEEKFSYCAVMPILCGFLVDMMSARGFGINIICYTYSALLCYAVGEHFFKQKLWFAVPMVLIGTFICESMYFILNFSDFNVRLIANAIKEVIIPVTIYNTFMTFVIYPLLKKTIYTVRHEYKRFLKR